MSKLNKLVIILVLAPVMITMTTGYGHVPQPSQAQGGVSLPLSAQGNTPPHLPSDCSEAGGTICAYGYVYYDGVPVAGADVTIESPYGALDTTTVSGPSSSYPYYGVDLSSAPLLVSPGDIITVTATYYGGSASTTYQVVPDGHQYVNSLVLDSAGNKWFGTEGGVSALEETPTPTPTPTPTSTPLYTEWEDLPLGNPGFERGLSGWMIRSGGWEVTTFSPHSGSYSARKPDGPHPGFIFQDLDLSPWRDLISQGRGWAVIGLYSTTQHNPSGGDYLILRFRQGETDLRVYERGCTRHHEWAEDWEERPIPPETDNIRAEFGTCNDSTRIDDTYARVRFEIPTPTPTPTDTPTPPAGDDYEPDDTCADARPITTDGTAQFHTFHQYADKDWVYFTASSGTTYIIQTANVGPDANTILELHDECELPPIAEDENPFGSTAQIIWTAPADGAYYLKVTNHDPDQYGDEATYDLSIRTQPSGGAAIIVAGHDDGYRLQSNIAYCTNRAYEVFASGGIPVGNIYYLTPDDSNPYRDADSTSANLQYAIESWAVGKVGPGILLYLYLMDHGGLDTFLTNGSDDTTSPSELDAWLTTLEQSTSADTINIFIESCRSGSFIDGWQEVAGPGRVVIASTSRNYNAYASVQGAYFSDAFFTTVGESKDLCESFREGEVAVRATGLRQDPWIDDDGDAVPNEPEDCELAQRRGLAAFFGDRPPVIDSITVPVRIEGYVGTIKAQVRDDVRVDDVWAVIYPPSFEEPEPTDTMPELDLTSIKLLDLDGDGEYSGTYGGFTEIGQYHIVVYAEDDEGDQAAPKGADVRRGWEVYLPMLLKAHIP